MYIVELVFNLCCNEFILLSTEAVNWEDESCEDGVLVKQTAHGFTTAVPVPSALFKFVIGRRGETKKKIEKETSSQIQIPKMGQEGDISLCFNDACCVLWSYSLCYRYYCFVHQNCENLLARFY